MLEQAERRPEGEDRDRLVEAQRRHRRREPPVGRFVAACRHCCRPVESLDDLELAPFHPLATEGHVHTDEDHARHMEALAGVCRADTGLLPATPDSIVDVTDPASQAAGVAWWAGLTGRGGEGMVVKPLPFVHRAGRAGSDATAGNPDLVLSALPTANARSSRGPGGRSRTPGP